MNTIATIFEDDTPFSRQTGACTWKDGNIVCDRTQQVAVAGVVMDKELEDALKQRSAKNGKISIVVRDQAGRAYSMIIETKFAY